MVKVRNLKKHMERFIEVVNGLKEGKREMAKQVQELAASIDTLLSKIKVSLCSPLSCNPEHSCSGDFKAARDNSCSGALGVIHAHFCGFLCVKQRQIFQSIFRTISMASSDMYGSLHPHLPCTASLLLFYTVPFPKCAVPFSKSFSQNQYFQSPQDKKESLVKKKTSYPVQ